jgi:hypothetical protein
VLGLGGAKNAAQFVAAEFNIDKASADPFSFTVRAATFTSM